MNPARPRFRAEFFIALACVAFIGWNLKKLMAFSRDQAEDAFARTSAGLTLSNPTGTSLEYASLVRQYRPQARTCFYWTLPSQRSTVSAENRILELNYRLYPARVRYRDDTAIDLCDVVLCERCFRSSVERQLKKMGLDGVFVEVHENAIACVFLRAHP